MTIEAPKDPTPTIEELPPPGYTQTVHDESAAIVKGSGITAEEAEEYADKADKEDL